MSVDTASRLVEERNSSRNWAPTARPVGVRLQPARTALAAVESLVTAGTPPEPVVKSGVSLPTPSWMALVSSPLGGVVVLDDDGLALADERRNRDLHRIRRGPQSDGGDHDGGAAGSDSECGGRGQGERVQVLGEHERDIPAGFGNRGAGQLGRGGVGGPPRKSPESPYRGLVKVTSVRRWRSLLMGPWPATGGVGPAEPHIGPAKRYRVAGLERLGAVVVAAGRGEVGLHGGVVRVAAGLVLVVGLVVPGPVVEILVLVGGLGAVEPVDGHALAGRGVRGGGVVTGVDVSEVQPTAVKPAL